MSQLSKAWPLPLPARQRPLSALKRVKKSLWDLRAEKIQSSPFSRHNFQSLTPTLAQPPAADFDLQQGKNPLWDLWRDFIQARTKSWRKSSKPDQIPKPSKFPNYPNPILVIKGNPKFLKLPSVFSLTPLADLELPNVTKKNPNPNPQDINSIIVIQFMSLLYWRRGRYQGRSEGGVIVGLGSGPLGVVFSISRDTEPDRPQHSERIRRWFTPAMTVPMIIMTKDM